MTQSIEVCACSGRRRRYLVGAGRRTVIDSKVGCHPDFLGKVLRSLNADNWNKGRRKTRGPLTVRARPSSNRVASKPPCTIPSCPQRPRPTCTRINPSDSSRRARTSGGSARRPGPRRAPAVRLLTRRSSGKDLYGRVSYHASRSSAARCLCNIGSCWSSSSSASVYACDSGRLGSEVAEQGAGRYKLLALVGRMRRRYTRWTPRSQLKKRFVAHARRAGIPQNRKRLMTRMGVDFLSGRGFVERASSTWVVNLLGGSYDKVYIGSLWCSL
jgi:hypothetical protein